MKNLWREKIDKNLDNNIREMKFFLIKRSAPSVSLLQVLIDQTDQKWMESR